MPRFYIKKGLATPELKEYIQANKDEPFLRVDIEIETDHERLRRSFHALIKAWFKSGEYSANLEKIKTYEALRDYYKLQGCDGVPEWYRFGKYNTKDKTEITNHLEPMYHRFIVEDPKSWSKMTKKEKSNCLDILLTEIRHSMTNNQDVLNWVDKINGEYELLRS